MKRSVLPLLLLAGLSWCGPAARAQAVESEAYEDEYRAGDFGRVRNLENGAAIVRAASEASTGAEEPASQNAPLFPGDTIRTSGEERVEIELAGGTLLRLDHDSELTLQALPAASASYSDNTILKLSRGTLQIAARKQDKGEVRIDTPASSVFPLESGEVRIAVDRDGRTHVASRRGVAEVVGDEGSVLVRGGMRTVVDPGAVPEDPRSFNTFATDGFDRWVAEVDVAPSGDERAQASPEVYEELPGEVRPYYRELSAHGRWAYLPTYGHVWYPYGDAGFRPYLDGSWYYGPRGYFWVSSEPWGWAPYHYGRWTWAAPYGWCWAPGRVFAGAWVSWSWGSAYVGWCPLDYWNRPAYHGHRHHGVYDPSCWTFVRYPHLTAHGYRRYAVPADRIGTELGSSAVVTRAPRIPPGDLARDPVQRQRAVRSARATERAGLHRAPPAAAPARSFREVERSVQRTPGAASPSASPLRRRSLPPDRPVGVQRTPRIVGAPEPTLPSPSGRASSDRLRDMYRRMASPRVTREREPGPAVRPPAPVRQPETAHRGRPAPPPAPRVSAPAQPQPQRSRAAPPRAAPGGGSQKGRGREAKKK